ncbi:WXG100 family type VII secretion target [Nocardioides sp. L-11A]|uniref:WXG100 family type VII secretion target n=1 Tax=Nocardioides sp. L-11A TaxID=3043848 RepID=UPI00249CA394|nr:WXG100 family type VII secretion target [Nocardioides sp. L-11A]
MVNLNVTYADLTSAAAQLRQGRDELNQKLHELGNLVDNLVGSGFQTDHASKAYDEQFDQFQVGTKQAIDALDGLSTFLDQAASAMEQTDSELANSIKS